MQKCTFKPLKGGRYRCNQTGVRLKRRQLASYRHAYLGGRLAKKKPDIQPVVRSIQPAIRTVHLDYYGYACCSMCGCEDFFGKNQSGNTKRCRSCGVEFRLS